MQPVGMSLEQQASSGVYEPYVLVAAYTENQATTDMPFSLVSDPADAFACTSAVQGNSQVFTCYPKRSLASVTLTASGPNPDDPTQRVTAALGLTDVGECLQTPARQLGHKGKSLASRVCSHC